MNDFFDDTKKTKDELILLVKEQRKRISSLVNISDTITLENTFLRGIAEKLATSLENFSNKWS